MKKTKTPEKKPVKKTKSNAKSLPDTVVRKRAKGARRITWRVADGPLHELPEGAVVMFEDDEWKLLISLDDMTEALKYLNELG